MPIYNDNRMLLSSPTTRELVTRSFVNLTRAAINESYINLVVAGTSTAGIPWATLLATTLRTPMVYIRDKPKDHGLRNQIEGIGAESDLTRKRVIVIEDLISTGGSSAAAVQAVREANGNCDRCFSIFNYGFQEAQEMFDGKRPFDKEGKRVLSPACNVQSVFTYDQLLAVAKKTGRITQEQQTMLEEWRQDPFNWGEKRGFPRGVKK